MDRGQTLLTGREVHSSARDARMAPALENIFLLLLVLAHQALNARLGYLDKNFRKDKRKDEKTKTYKWFVEQVLKVGDIEGAHKVLVRG